MFRDRLAVVQAEAEAGWHVGGNELDGDDLTALFLGEIQFPPAMFRFNRVR